MEDIDPPEAAPDSPLQQPVPRRSARQDTEPTHTGHRRPWSRRHSFFGIRNGRLMVLILVALAAGVAATYATAYLGIR